MKFNFNHDDKRRCELLGIKYPADWSYGGCIHFKNLNNENFNLLAMENFIDPYDSQNDSPTADEFREFINKYPEVTAHGYAVSPDRYDYRVTIEGIEYYGIVSKEMLIDFINLCRYADEFIIEDDMLYCWFD